MRERGRSVWLRALGYAGARRIPTSETGDEEVDVCDLAEEIVDRIRPPVCLGDDDPLERVDTTLAALEAAGVTISEDALALLDTQEPGAAAARLRGLAGLIERCGAYGPPKPRIRVRAATQHTA